MGCGPCGFGRRARIPFALSTTTRPLSAKTLVGYHAVGKKPTGSTALGEAAAARSNTATALSPAAVTYNFRFATEHEVGALPKRAVAPWGPGKRTRYVATTE